MGGTGSGDWHRVNKKSTVEESLTVAIWDLRGRINPNSYGAIEWRSGSPKVYSIGFFITLSDAPAISLNYRWGDCEDVKTKIPLQSTPTQFGGIRWWFSCPLNSKGAPCGRRVGKLHLPPGRIISAVVAVTL